MTIIDRIESFAFDANRDLKYGLKSGIVWGNSSEKNVTFPMLYISKPRYISQDDYEILLDSIEINFNARVEV